MLTRRKEKKSIDKERISNTDLVDYTDFRGFYKAKYWYFTAYKTNRLSNLKTAFCEEMISIEYMCLSVFCQSYPCFETT